MPQGMNRVVLTAGIAEQTALRYNPAGLPVLDLMLEHASTQQESGDERQVRLVLKAKAFGALAESIAVQPIGSSWRFTGFLASPRSGSHPVFHIQEFQQA